MKHQRVARLACAAIGLFAAGASASVIISRTIEQMIAEVPLVVRGTVGQVQSRWDDAHARIHTYAEIQVREVMKGSSSGSLIVRQPGGVADDGMAMDVSGTAKFQSGEEVLLFLEKAPDEAGVFNTWGLSAGK